MDSSSMRSTAPVSFTYNRPGTFTAMVMAEDAPLGISSESFTVSIDDLAPL